MSSTSRDHKAPAWRLGLAPALLILVGAFAGHPSSANAASLQPLNPPWVDEPDLQPDAASGATGDATSDALTPVAATPAVDASSADASPAGASPDAALADAFSDDSGFKPMTKSEMSEARGGLDGVAFGIFLTGTLNAPQSTTLPPGVTVTPLGSGQVQIIGGLGNLAGANGIFQFTNVIGDLNVINNNLIINVVIQSQSPTTTSSVGF
jgi:hypothetical protein